MKTLVIGRFQPFHNGHLGMIKWAASKSDHITIGIGSSNESRTYRNPYTFEERKKIIEASLSLDIPYNIVGIPDCGNNYKWSIWITDNIDFDVFMTNSEKEKRIIEGAGREVAWLDFKELDVSGTMVRTRLFENKDCSKLVPKEALEVMSEIRFSVDSGEETFLNPSATADVIVVKKSKVLLVRRKNDPFKDMWALPGGYLNHGKESLEEAAIRELKEETGLSASKTNLKLINAYSEPSRDPRGHVISHVYVAMKYSGELVAGSDAKEVRFWSLNSLPPLAFDHKRMLDDYIGMR